MDKNKIPRKFICITGKILIDTTATKAGDILKIYKNDFGYLFLNTNSGVYRYISATMLRDKKLFEIMEILK